MKRPFSNYLKLLKKFIKSDSFKRTTDFNHMPFNQIIKYESDRILVKAYYSDYPRERREYTVLYSTGQIYFNEETIGIVFTRYQKHNYEFEIKDNFDGKDEFFNYILHHDLEYFTYEDLVQLREIKEIVLHLINQEN